MRLLSYFLYFNLTWLLWGCAHQVSPSGGPVDKIPPEIIAITPENRATNVPRDQEIVFEFSESMDRRALEKALFIAPDPGENGVKTKWKGRKLHIQFTDSLDTDRTYVITLGTDLRDSHNIALNKSYTLAFSTGVTISEGKISGQVYTEGAASGILLWAYILEDNAEPNPVQDTPAYVIQTDNQGQFELSNLSEGTYRVFAVQDMDKNRFFEKGLDGLSVPQEDVRLTPEIQSVQGVDFRVAIADTLGPALVSVSANNRTRVALRFDENLDSATTDSPQNYHIAKSKTAPGTLRVTTAYLNRLDPQEVILLTGQQAPGTEYQVTVEGVRDSSGNAVDPEFKSERFSASALADTVRPRIAKITPADSAKAVLQAAPIIFHFSEPVQPQPFEHSVQVSDTTGLISSSTVSWTTPAMAVMTPDAPRKSATVYHVSAPLDSVIDLSGNAFSDSLFKSKFTVVNVDTFSSISGILTDPDSTAEGKIFLTARQTTKGGAVYTLELTAPGPYEFTNLLPGDYKIEGFRDRDSDGKYSFGRAVPFVPAERFFVYPEPIRIRARWPNEGNDISFEPKKIKTGPVPE